VDDDDLETRSGGGEIVPSAMEEEKEETDYDNDADNDGSGESGVRARKALYPPKKGKKSAPRPSDTAKSQNEWKSEEKWLAPLGRFIEIIFRWSSTIILALYIGIWLFLGISSIFACEESFDPASGCPNLRDLVSSSGVSGLVEWQGECVASAEVERFIDDSETVI